MAAFSLSTVGHPIIPACIPGSGKSKNAVTDTIPQGSLNDGKEPTDSVAPALADSTATDESLKSGTRSDDFANGVITAPEQPEGTAFMPTMMGDIEAATPTAGINIIAPPSANNHGSASLQYPFIMPPARNGMSPTLGLAYDSDAGDGICGEGWTLPVSSITVDTRWGVPRYSTQKETETYLLDGQMLAMQSGSSLYLAHRNASISRNSSGNRRFHPRTGTDFSLIERSNYTPSTYTWKVTAPDGTEYTYGGGNATLKGTFTDASGTTREVIAEWLLSRVEDPHGDYVTYSYHTSNESSVGNLNSKAVYLDSIRAFLNDGTLHTVVKLFYGNRSSQDGHMCSARYGFLSSSNQLLDSVVVRFNGSYLRKYELQYASGRFGKPLLTRVIHYDDHRNVASFQDFSYYDETNGAGELVQPQNDAVLIQAESDGLEEDFFINQSDRSSSIIGSSTTQSKSVSLYAGLGVWNGSLWKDNTAGASYEYSDDRTKGIVTLTDIDGDGLPDKVFRKSGGLWYRPMQVSSNGEMSLGYPVRLETSVGSFSTVKSHTNNIGLRGVTGAFGISFQRGWDWHSTKASTTEYMADVNGDGLPDLVSGGKVWFNHLGNSGGTTVPTFTEGSHLSPNPIMYSAAPDLSVISAPTQTQLDSIADASPMQDVVRVWEAPENGTVSISGNVELQDPPSGYDESEYAKADGVRVAIEKGGTTLWNHTMGRDDHGAYQPSGVSSVSVTRGDRIFFRVQCGGARNSNGAYDRVTWSPTVQYTTGGNNTTPDGVVAGVYPCTQAVISNTGEMASTGKALSIRLRGLMIKPVTSDSVVFRAVVTNNLVDSQGQPLPEFQADTIFYKRLTYLESINQLLDTVVCNTHQLPYLKVEMSSPTNVKWDAVRWTPTVMYTDSVGNDQETAIIPYVNAFTQTFREPTPVVIAQQGASVVVSPSLTLPAYANGKVSLVVKGTNRTWARKEYIVANGVITGTVYPLAFYAPGTGSAWVEYYWPDTLGRQASVACSATVWVNGTPVNSSFNTGFHARRKDLSMGLMHRGWGAFIYNAAAGRHAQSINESLLHTPEVQPGDSLRFDQLVFMPFTATIDTQGNLSWVGPRDETFVSETDMGTARLGEQNVTWSNPLSSSYNSAASGSGDFKGTGAPAPVLVSSSDGRTDQDGIGILGPAFTNNTSSSATKGEVSLLDMNGDGYPDIIANGIIQYTNTLGGMSGESASGMPMPESSASSVASGVGGSPVNAASTIVSVVSGGKASASGRLASQLGKISLSGNVAINSDMSKHDYLDLNGDGLPDLLFDNNGTLKARLNLGYSFSEQITVGTGHIQKGVSQSSNKGIGAGNEFGFGSIIEGTDIHIASSSFSAGVGISSTISTEKQSLVDLNGDGLPDIVWVNESGIWARLNMGNSFAADSVKWASGGSVGKSTTTGESANAAFTVTINVPVIGMKFCVNPGGALGKSVTRTRMAIRDIDGDGFPDIVTSDSENGISVRFSNIRRTNKLKTVTNSLGGKFTLDYAHSTPTYGLPGGKWVMSSVEVDRGIHFSGCDIPVTRKAFTYTGGVRDRREREFLGFAEVVTTDLDALNDYAAYRSVQETFDVSSYYRRGLPLATTLRDASDNKFTETENIFYIYSVRPNSSNKIKYALNTTAPSETWPMAYTPVKFTENRNYEGGSNVIKSQSGYSYYTSACGEVAYYYHSSSGSMPSTGSSFTNYDYRTYIIYSRTQGNANSQLRRTINRPTLAVVTGGDGTVYHKTSAAYADNQNAAKVSSIVRNYSVSGSDTTKVKFTYDQYTGNLKSMSQYSGSRTLSRSYFYDDNYLNTYPYQIKDQHQLKTNIEGMDLKYGFQTQVEDPNSSVIHTIYDGLGRLESVKSPNERTDSSTIDMSYSPIAVMKADGTGIQTPAHAVTTYHLRQPYESGNTISTHCSTMRVVTFTDGFGQVVQTRRESIIDNGSGSQSKMVVIDGGMAYDGLGRAVKEYYPTQATASTLMTYQPTAQSNVYYTRTEHDVLDRPVSVTTADGAVTRYNYDVSGGCLRTTVTDPLNRKSQTYADATGKTLKTVMYRDIEATIPIETHYGYDAIGRLTRVINAAGDSTLISYDMLDRRTEVRHPASGTTRWTYDKLGNVLTEENETLRAQGEKIRYTWDVDRLMRVACPDDTVTYHYGSANDGLTNTKGRPNFRRDRSGGTEYGYDAMGNVSYEKRSVVVPGKGLATFETAWEYDAYGKLLNMTYPGDEKLVYHYNAMGDLDRVYRGRENSGLDYVSSIGYDRFGSRVRIVYANGTSTRYGYNGQTRRLSSIVSFKGSTMRASNNFTYDLVGNIIMCAGTRPDSQTHVYRYSYDALDRLSSATQRYGGNTAFATDTLSMAYDDLWRITSKSQRLSQTGLMLPGTLNTGYSLTYNYDTAWGRHYRIKNVGETHYRTMETPSAADNIYSTHWHGYDGNGNLSSVVTDRRRDNQNVTGNVSERKMSWDSQNRLRGLCDNGYVSLYWYDADGNRTVKEHLGGEAVWVNGTHAGQRTDTLTYSVYPNAYVSINGDRWTKHYYIGSERIASRTGTLSDFNNLDAYDNYSAGHDIQSVNYDSMIAAEEDSIAAMYERHGVPYVVQHAATRGNVGHLYIPITRDNDDTAETASQNRNHPHPMDGGQVYYFHRDHLGGTLSVTDSLGAYVQQVEYTPWGEVFVEKQSGSSGYESPYLFNGKELDEETGLYYYGARYYDPKTSVWYSVDPFSNYNPLSNENHLDGKHNNGVFYHGNLNPYIYCYHRPTLYVDPNGKQGLSGAIFGAFVGGFTEYASIVGSKVLFKNMTFKEANMDLTWRDGVDISVSAGFGAASGLIDNGISRLTQWIAKPRNRKIVTKILETGMDTMEEALKQYLGYGEISISSMLVGTLTEVGMGNLIGEKYVKKALREANNAVNVAERRLADLCKRRHPNAKLIHKAQEEVNNAKQFLNLIKGIDVGSETAKKTISKGVSSKDD